MSHLPPFYTVSSGIALTIKEEKPDFKNLTIKKCSMSNKTIVNYNDIINENMQGDNNPNKSQSHLVNSTLDIQSLPDVFNCSVSSNNDKTHGNKGSSAKYKLIIDKRLKKNQSSSTGKGLKMKVKIKRIDFDNNAEYNGKVDVNKSHMALRLIDRKQEYLSYVEENRKLTRKMYILNHGDRKYRADLRRFYNPYYV